MSYLLLTRSEDFRPAPLFGELLKGDPHIFDFSSGNPKVYEYASGDFDRFQAQVFAELAAANKSWGLSHYLEERAALLRLFPQMAEEGRVIHAGLDVIVPKGAQLFAPLSGTVHTLGLDEGIGNYGGYIVLLHAAGIDHEGETDFYSLYGHLNTHFSVEERQPVERAEPFAITGSHGDSGQWFTHTHLQIHTQRSVNEGRLLQGYISQATIEGVDDLFPTPYPLFRAD
ncbi:MAG: peptidoglycan DD-metalloendopeptidase family protein [Planctomycetes bacterium]|nr:peptidoglycan DD-metalloendopeptidase family protein [Planctomycetota bacterium]